MMWIAALALMCCAFQAQNETVSPDAQLALSRMRPTPCTLLAKGEGYLVHRVPKLSNLPGLMLSSDAFPSHVVYTDTKTGEMKSLFSEYSYGDMRRRQMCYASRLLGVEAQGHHLFIFGWTAEQWDHPPYAIHPTRIKADASTRMRQSYALVVYDLLSGKVAAFHQLKGDQAPPSIP